ncbi:MAG: hypothetical protein ACKV22_31195 [Bryobacteraceae bacterium]
MSLSIAFLAASFFPVLPLAGADDERDFTGSWKLNPSRSDVRALPEAPAIALEIEQKAGVIHFKAADPLPVPMAWTYSATGKETRHKMGEAALSSVTKWEGTALLVTTIVSGPQNYSRMERWKLSRDRRTLTVQTQIVRRTGESESTLVYERDGVIEPAPQPTLSTRPPAEGPAPSPAPAERAYLIPAGTKIPLRLLSTVSSRHSSDGDRVHLETSFPVMDGNRMVIPPGSAVMATVTQVTRSGKVKGRGGFFLRFDSITLPNGVTRDLRSRPSAIDGDNGVELDRTEGEVKARGNKSGDARTIGTTTAAGAGIGSAVGRSAAGAGIGAAAGAAAGLAGVLFGRGPNAVLERGTNLEMVLDRDLRFGEKELAR